MMDRFALAIAAVAILAFCPAPTLAQENTSAPLRIGVVVPSRSGEMPIPASINDYTGEGALMGARLSEASLADLADGYGLGLDVLLASSPTPEAAQRAAERLVEVDKVSALVGGIGEGQAKVLLNVAESAEIPFLNIGDTDPALRNKDCSRLAFHIEASRAMYLDAMAAVASNQSWNRWFIVHEDTPDGDTMRARAEEALGKFIGEGKVVGTTAVVAQQPTYFEEIDDAVELDADVIVLLVDPFDQMLFIAQQEEVAPSLPTLGFPDTLSQTRDYIAAARFTAPNANPDHRVALWETTLEAEGAGDFNETYRSRWGEPADPTSWAAFEAIRVLIEGAHDAGSTEGQAIAEALAQPGFKADLLKGEGVSFRSWDHQLRQPLYGVTVNPDVVWERMKLETRIQIAGNPVRLPSMDEDADAVAQLDRLGDGPEETGCKF